MLHFRFVKGAAIGLAATGAAPALASSPARNSPAVVAVETSASKPTTIKSQATPDFATIMVMIDKLFPAQPDPDPARLALSRTSAQAIWPDGAYTKMMSGLLGGVFDRVMKLKQSDVAVFAKTSNATAAANEASIHDKAVAKDPYFDQRVAAIRGAIDDELGKVSAVLDPRVREGLARAMAHRFDAQQLTQINGFFATPTGQKFAGQYMQLWVDPDMIRSMFSSMPEMMKLMPDMMQKIKAANDKYPKPPEAAKPADPEKRAKPSAKKAKH